jgi:hypothetical protein
VVDVGETLVVETCAWGAWAESLDLPAVLRAVQG